MATDSSSLPSFIFINSPRVQSPAVSPSSPFQYSSANGLYDTAFERDHQRYVSRRPTSLAIESSCTCNCRHVFSVFNLLVLCVVLDVLPDSPISRQNVPGNIKSGRQSLPVCNIVLVQLYECVAILKWIIDTPPLLTSTCLLAPVSHANADLQCCGKLTRRSSTGKTLR